MMMFQVAYVRANKQATRNFKSRKQAEDYAAGLQSKGLEIIGIVAFEPTSLRPAYGDWRTAEDKLAEARDKRAIQALYHQK